MALKRLEDEELEFVWETLRNMDIPTFDAWAASVFARNDVLCERTSELMRSALITEVGLTPKQAEDGASMFNSILAYVLYMLDDTPKYVGLVN